jgi:DNA-binding XRE family transcriptional regulator
VISGAQVRAARALLRWSSRELAKKASLSIFTVEAIENDDDDISHPDTPAIKTALEAGGVEFINSIGVVMRPESRNAKTRWALCCSMTTMHNMIDAASVPIVPMIDQVGSIDHHQAATARGAVLASERRGAAAG